MVISNLTHDYDGKINHNFTVETPLNIEIITTLKSKLTPLARTSIDLILGDRGNNYDPSNKLNALELLNEIAHKEGDHLNYLGEQLEDIIRSGPCAQGRCARLYQVWLTLSG